MENIYCEDYCYQKTRIIDHLIHNKTSKIKLVLFDMDGVLTDIKSSWKYIHDYYNSSNNQSVHLYLSGQIDDLEFIRRDISLWKENGRLIKINKLIEILSSVPLMKGAENTIRILHQNHIKTGIISAGLEILADRVAKNLKIDFVCANGIKTDNQGYLTGEGLLNVQLMYKDKNVLEISKNLGIPLNNIAGVGNSCFDIPMINNCGLGIAFNPGDDCIRNAADFIVEERDLSLILPFLKKYM